MIGNKRVDDGYTGLIMNPKTGQVLYASAELNKDPFYIRVKSADDVPKVIASRPVDLIETITDPETKEPVALPESTPEAEVKVDEDSGELVLVTIQAEASSCNDKPKLKEIGKTLGLKLTKTMNIDTMKERIANQIAQIRAASTGE